MITYNHEDYIIEAIESILAQVTNFSIQLIIGEDCSTDKTRAICAEYVNKYPDKILLLPSVANVGMMQNFLRTYKACNGKYIAFCEGDDYWTDNYKLQKQIDFLEANPDYSSCFHKVILKKQRNGEDRDELMPDLLGKETFTTEDMLGPWFIASPSFVFVNYADFVLPDWFFHCQYGDLPFMLLLTLRGKIKLIDEFMGVYRQHDRGLSIAYKVYDKILVMAYIYASFDIYTNYKYHETIRKSIAYLFATEVPPNVVYAPTIWQNIISFLKSIYSWIRRVLQITDKAQAGIVSIQS